MLAAGTKLGPYEILAPLGAGGMGEVWRAHDPRLGRDVAIKALPGEFARDPERLARFRREAQTLAALNHPNVASIFGLEEAGGSPLLVLELVEGESLQVRLARGPLAAREALRIGVQVASAIEAAHERGIVHRDLKPANVMLSTSGVAKVLDFGLARSEVVAPPPGDPTDSPTLTAAAGATLAGAILGTAAYMSPEQARGLQVDRRSDVWSFGCLLFECLAGRQAFEGATASDLIARILEREPDWTALPAGTPAPVREVLRRCLRKDADARPRDIRDVRLELSELAGGGGKAGPAPGNSIAVLPFENLSGADDAYFADGVTDEILNALSQLEGLRVAARTSCFAFKGRREDPRAVGEKLDVTTVLEGTVRRSGARLRITAQLVNASDGYQLWSERYDGEMTEVFEVQDRIAEAIARRLRVTLQGAAGERGRRGTDSVEAYELFLKGRALLLQRGRFIQEAIQLFERAIDLDPRYAEAMALLGDSHRLLGTFSALPCVQVMPRAREMASRALEIEPGLAEAWATLASVESQYEHRLDRAAISWRRALESDPRHVRTRCERAMWSYAFGVMGVEQGVAETLLAVEHDPFNAWALCIHSFLLGYAGRVADSLAAAERAVEADPGSFFAQWTRMRAYGIAGDLGKAMDIAPGLLISSGRNVWALGTYGWLLARSGEKDMAVAVHDEMKARARLEHVSHFWLSVSAAAAGEPEEALAHVRGAVVDRDPLMVQVRVFPHCDGVRAIPGFEDAVKGAWDPMPA